MAFLNPFFLLGGLAVAVPILLHLIRRQNARKIEFPTLMFLRKIDKKAIRYQKLRRLLLLFLRILAFLLIVLAFMRPYREKAPVSTAMMGTYSSAHIIALDNSMSMRYQDRWDRAKAAARDIVRQASSGDTFALLEFSDRTLIRTELTGDKPTVLSAIENASEPGDQATRYAQALRVAGKIALSADTKNRIIHLISDFQKNGWEDGEPAIQLGTDIELQPVDLGSEEFSNLAIRNVRTVEADQGETSNLNIQASIVELGDRDRKDVRVGLTVDDRAFSEQTVPVSGGIVKEVEFQIPNLSPGEHTIVLEIDDPSLEEDNRFYMTVDIRGNIPVTVVENPPPRGGRPPSFFLTRALNVESLSPYQVKTVSPETLDTSERLLIWNNIPTATTAVQKRLETFIQGGGGMILVLGDSKQASEFNRSFGTWLPIRMVEADSGTRTGDFVLMTDIRTDHPIFKPFEKPHSGTFSSPRFYNHARIIADPEAEILARFDNGDPALIAITKDKGRILVFTSTADGSGNDLPLSTVYAPFWQQMVRYLESSENERNWLEIGDVIDPRRILYEKAFLGGVAEPDPDETIAMLDPHKQRMEPAPDSGSIITDTAGFYDIRSVSVNASVAVNTVPAESDLTHRNTEEMTAALVSSQPAAFSVDETPAAEVKDNSQKIWIFLFIAALLFLISELLVSNSGLKAKNDDVQKIAALNS